MSINEDNINLKRVEKFWDRISKKYDKRENTFNPTYIKSVRNTKKLLKNDDVVLDYACATGNLSIDIAANVKQIYAVDISSKMIQLAKGKALKRKVENVIFEHSTIFDKRLNNNSFNAVLGFNILHLLDDGEKAIERINELLNPGGLFISNTVHIPLKADTHSGN